MALHPRYGDDMAEYFRRAVTAPRPGAVRPGADGVPGPSRFLNRELSWLDFGSRLLDLAADDKEPLFERVKFLAIFASGLDEFFQVRVAGLKDQVAAGVRSTSPDGMTPAEQLAAIRVRALDLVKRHSDIFSADIQPALRQNGIY